MDTKSSSSHQVHWAKVLSQYHFGLIIVNAKLMELRNIFDTPSSLLRTKFLSAERTFFLCYFSSRDTFWKKMSGKPRNRGGDA